jgi:hypothetical protein
MHHRVQKRKKSREKLKSRPQGDAEHDEATKIVPKGAQRKFSTQKSFLRERRAKYRRNIRRRSSKVVPKGMQNLHQKINGEHRKINSEEDSKVIPKGMQSLGVAS